jgi:hypothetical protein
MSSSDYYGPNAHRAHLESLQRKNRIAAEAKHRERRERIATAALQGVLVNERRQTLNENVRNAVAYADALIAELDKEVQP